MLCVFIRHSGKLNELGSLLSKQVKASVLKANKKHHHHNTKLYDLTVIDSTNPIKVEMKR